MRSIPARGWGKEEVLAQNDGEHSLDNQVKMGLKFLLLFKLIFLSSQSRCCEIVDLSH